jgi:hypothetical protein
LSTLKELFFFNAWVYAKSCQYLSNEHYQNHQPSTTMPLQRIFTLQVKILFFALACSLYAQGQHDICASKQDVPASVVFRTFFKQNLLFGYAQTTDAATSFLTLHSNIRCDFFSCSYLDKQRKCVYSLHKLLAGPGLQQRLVRERERQCNGHLSLQQQKTALHALKDRLLLTSFLDPAPWIDNFKEGVVTVKDYVKRPKSPLYVYVI